MLQGRFYGWRRSGRRWALMSSEGQMVAMARAGGSDVAGFRARARFCLVVAGGR